jgi:hypothetical protein
VTGHVSTPRQVFLSSVKPACPDSEAIGWARLGLLLPRSLPLLLPGPLRVRGPHWQPLGPAPAALRVRTVSPSRAPGSPLRLSDPPPCTAAAAAASGMWGSGPRTPCARRAAGVAWLDEQLEMLHWRQPRPGRVDEARRRVKAASARGGSRPVQASWPGSRKPPSAAALPAPLAMLSPTRTDAHLPVGLGRGINLKRRPLSFRHLGGEINLEV